MLKYYDEFSINKKKVYILAAITTILCCVMFFKYLTTEIGKSKFIYDYIFYVFSDFYFVSYFTSMMFLYLIHYISKKDSFEQYKLLRFKNKIMWYKHKLIVLAAYAIGFVFFTLLVCILIGSSTLSFKNISLYINKIVTLKKYPLLTLVVINMSFLACYLYIIGLVYFISNIRARNSFIGFIVSYGLVVCILNIPIQFMRLKSIYKLSSVKNVLLGEHNTVFNKFSPSLLSSTIYFSSIILILILIGFIIVKKSDLHYGGKKV